MSREGDGQGQGQGQVTSRVCSVMDNNNDVSDQVMHFHPLDYSARAAISHGT